MSEIRTVSVKPTERQLIEMDYRGAELGEPGFINLPMHYTKGGIEPMMLTEAVRRAREDWFKEVKPPFTVRLAYYDDKDFCVVKNFAVSGPAELFLGVLDSSKLLIENNEIDRAPTRISLLVLRPSEWKNSGRWIEVMDFTLFYESPYFSFEELELARGEIYGQLTWYAQRNTNPCGEVPLVDQGLGKFLPKG